MRTQVTNLRYRRMWFVRTGTQSVRRDAEGCKRNFAKESMQTQVTNLRYRRM